MDHQADAVAGDLLAGFPIEHKWVSASDYYGARQRPFEIDYGFSWRIHSDASMRATCRVAYIPDWGQVYATYGLLYTTIGKTRAFDRATLERLLDGWEAKEIERTPVLWVWKKLNRLYKSPLHFARAYARRHGVTANKHGQIVDREGRLIDETWDDYADFLTNGADVQVLADGRVHAYVPLMETVNDGATGLLSIER